MKTIFYKNRLAKLILFKGYSTIMLFGFILTKREKWQLRKATIRHEQIHQRQYVECMAMSAIPALILSFLVSPWFLLLVPTWYYILYLLEWAVAFVYHLFKDSSDGISKENSKAYHSSAMEMEAYGNQADESYLEGRKRFAWFKYYGTI